MKQLRPYWAKQRGKANDNFYSKKKWQRVRTLERYKQPVCVYCYPVVTPSEHIDHILPRSLFPELEFESSNLAGVCSSCHGKKTIIEQGIKSRNEAEEKLSIYKQKKHDYEKV